MDNMTADQAEKRLVDAVVSMTNIIPMESPPVDKVFNELNDARESLFAEIKQVCATLSAPRVPEPYPSSSEQQSGAWRAVWALLLELRPNFAHRESSGEAAALRAIRELAEEAQAVTSAPEGWQHMAAQWLEEQAVEQEQINEANPRHAEAYRAWRRRPATLRALAAKVRKAPGPNTEEPSLTCDICGMETDDPWHYSTEESRHNHACDECWPSVSDELTRLRERVAELEKDAERYQEIKHRAKRLHNAFFIDLDISEGPTDFECAIDAASAGKPGGSDHA